MSTLWPTRPLSEICDIQIGRTPTRSEPRFWGGDNPWLSIKDMNQGRELWDTAERISDEAVQNNTCRLVEPGTLLLSFKLSIGKVGIAQRPMYTNEAIAQLPILAPDVRRDYLYWALRTVPLTGEVDRAVMGLTLNKAKLKRIPIPVPPVEEQRRIAAVLDAADELRSKRRTALTKLDTLTQAIFIDMFGSPGDNPRRWPVKPLIELVDPNRPITYGILKPGDDVPDGVPYVRVVDMAGGRVLESALRRTTPEIAHQYRRSMLAEDDLLLSIRGHVGRMARVHGELAGANITQDTARLAIVGARPEYVFACMQAEESQRWMANFTKGAAVRGINLTDVKKFPVPVPPGHLQDEFAERAARVTAHVERCTASRSQLDALFASLQQRAFRGEL